MTEPSSLYWSVFRAILKKDIRIEMRSRENLAAMLVLSVLILFIFHFSLELQPENRNQIAPGVLWAAALFSGNIAISRIMASEKDRNSVDGLLLAAADRSAIFCAKSTAVFLFMLANNLILYPLFTVFYGVNVIHPGVILTGFLGTLGYAFAGTAVSAIAMHTRTREVLLPVLLFPLALPVIIAAVKACAGFLAEADLNQIQPWLNVLLVYDVILFTAMLMLSEDILEE